MDAACIPSALLVGRWTVCGSSDTIMDRMTSTCSFGRSRVRPPSVLSRIVFSVSVSAFFVVQGCAGETQERPISSGPRASTPERKTDSRLADLPLPETAFRDEEPAPAADRFATRSVGESSVSREKHFRGAPVDLDLRAADIHDVFRLLADVGRVNIVVAGEVSGQVTMKLRRVPWDQAMDVIARVRGLAYEREGNVILVRAAGTTAK